MKQVWKFLDNKGCLLPIYAVATMFFFIGFLWGRNHIFILKHRNCYKKEELIVDSLESVSGGYRGVSNTYAIGKINNREKVNGRLIQVVLPKKFKIPKDKNLTEVSIPVWFIEEQYGKSINAMRYRNIKETNFNVKPVLKQFLISFLVLNCPFIILVILYWFLNE